MVVLTGQGEHLVGYIRFIVALDDEEYNLNTFQFYKTFKSSYDDNFKFIKKKLKNKNIIKVN